MRNAVISSSIVVTAWALAQMAEASISGAKTLTKPGISLRSGTDCERSAPSRRSVRRIESGADGPSSGEA